jgi:hypothetical protein
MKDIEEKIGYLKEHICNKDGDKDYLFISYKSTDKELVLGEIVYKLVYDYGLNVYFDGDFDKHNSGWIKQFEENMESPHCKGFIAFISADYLISYATLLELMFSRTKQLKSVKGDIIPIYAVSINEGLEKNTLANENRADDTGLGQEINGESRNLLAIEERNKFEEYLHSLDINLYNEIRSIYPETKKILQKGVCSDIFDLILKTIVKQYRETIGIDENKLHELCIKIKNDLHESVFSEETNTKKEDIKTVKQEQKYIEKPADSVLKSGKKKSYGTYDFMLYGEKYENYKLKNVLITTFKEVINKNLDKLDILINQINCLQEGDVLKNKEYSSVFRAGEVVKFNGKEVTIGTSLNKEAVFNYINKLIELCGEDKEIFKDMTSSGTV